MSTPSSSRLINTVHSTEVMDPKKRAAGFYARRCQYGTCSLPAWYIQRAHRTDGAETMRVVCKGHSGIKSTQVQHWRKLPKSPVENQEQGLA